MRNMVHTYAGKAKCGEGRKKLWLTGSIFYPWPKPS